MKYIKIKNVSNDIIILCDCGCELHSYGLKRNIENPHNKNDIHLSHTSYCPMCGVKLDWEHAEIETGE